MRKDTRKDTTTLCQNLDHLLLLSPSCFPPSFPGVNPDPPPDLQTSTVGKRLRLAFWGVFRFSRVLILLTFPLKF